MQTFQKFICQVSSELVTGVQIVVVLHHLQNHHKSPAAAGPVPGFGDEGQSTPPTQDQKWFDGGFSGSLVKLRR